MAHNNQIVNGREGSEMEEEIEEGDHKGNNNAIASTAMASVEKGGGSNGGFHHQLWSTLAAINDGIGDGSHYCWWRWLSSTAAMAVFVNDNGKGRRR
jgi:hypothetical protein